ncbi:MAG: ACGX-repeat peptide [Lachnospiraceae bacterium]|nr:ACGX-repeat peptide [Lachnospiraceae bacterium]
MALSNLSGWKNETSAASCGAADKPAETPAACGSACGAADKPAETPAACGSACGAGDK